MTSPSSHRPLSGTFATKDGGNKSTGAVDLRDLLREDMLKSLKKVDQVVMGTVRAVKGLGESMEQVSVLMDGFKAGNINVGWAGAVPPEVGQRVTMIGLNGGQEWYVSGVLNDSTIGDITSRIEELEAAAEVHQQAISTLQESLTALTNRVIALENADG